MEKKSFFNLLVILKNQKLQPKPYYIQEHLSGSVLLSHCAEKFCKIHRKRTRVCNFIKKRLQQRCFPVSLVEFFRTVLAPVNSCFCMSKSEKCTELCRRFKMEVFLRKLLAIFAKSTILDVWQSSVYSFQNNVRYKIPETVEPCFS